MGGGRRGEEKKAPALSPRVLEISSDEKKTHGGGRSDAREGTEGENRSREVVEAVSFLSLLIRHLFRANCARLSRSYWFQPVFMILVRYKLAKK